MSVIVEEFHGTDALQYAKRHLTRVGVNQDTWEIEYVDDSTGQRWIMDYPESGLHGGGSPRLRRRDEGDFSPPATENE